MKQLYKDRDFRPASLETIERANKIIETYARQGLTLTLRQLYYQFVTRNWIPNTERSYKNLGSVVADGRVAGLIDWDGIEDRVRVPRIPREYSGLDSLVRAALYSYRLPRWKDQDSHVELWVEKDALAGVLMPLADRFHVTLMVNRGYSSQSAMRESAERIIEAGKPNNWIIYLGDHDPSGEDMVRDVQARLDLFGAQDTVVEKLALTMAQVEEYEPPPNPAKLSDSRAAAYVERHGGSSWEVDALPPEVLQELISDRLSELVDQDKMDKIIEQEGRDKADLTAAVAKLRGGRK